MVGVQAQSRRQTRLIHYVKLDSGIVVASPIPESALPAGINANQIADGSVSNAEFQALRNVASDIQAQFSGKQPIDADLTIYAGITPSANVQTLLGAASFAAFKTSLSVNNVDNTSDANKPISTATQAALDLKQGLDSDLTTIAGLTPTTDNFLVSVSSAWDSRTPAQVRTTLGLVIGTNVQAFDADLATWAGLTPSANAQSLVTAANYAAMRALLDLEPGTDFLGFPAGTPDGTKFLRDDNSWQAISGGTPGGSDTQLQRNNAGAFGAITGCLSAGTNITCTAGNLIATSPRFVTGINDSNGNELIEFTATGSAVNNVKVVNAAAGNAPSIEASGSDTDISINLTPKGAGGVNINGTGTSKIGIGDTDNSHFLNFIVGSNLSVDRNLTFTTGDAARVLDIGGNLTFAAAFITSGANSLTLTTTGATNVTLPTSGTLATTAAASESAAGLVELATTAEIDTATDAARAMAPDQFNASIFGEQVIQLVVLDTATAATTGDGKFYFVVPSKLNGMNLVGITAQVNAAGTTNTLNVDLARCAVVATGNMCSGTVVDMLSTNLTIDSTENRSATAAAAPVIDASNDDVATDQVIRVDIDAIQTTPSSGLIITLSFRKP